MCGCKNRYNYNHVLCIIQAYKIMKFENLTVCVIIIHYEGHVKEDLRDAVGTQFLELGISCKSYTA